jgi:hypothetical protein
LTVDHVISIGLRSDLMPVELGNVVLSEDRVDKELFLRSAPDSGTLEIGSRIDPL